MFDFMKMLSFLCLAFAMMSVPLVADFQTFTGSSGASLEVELIELNLSKNTVYIRFRSGKKVNADLSAFSSEDQREIKDWWQQVQADKQVLSAEARIDISAKMNRKSKGNRYSGYSRVDDKTKSFFPEIVIKNKDIEAYTGNVVCVVIVAKDLHDTDQRLIVSASTLTADFDGGSETILEGDPFRLRLYEYESSYSNYDYTYGYEYEGYVVIIKNSKGEITQMRATKKKYLSNLRLILECEAGQIYDDSLSRKLNVRPNSYYIR